MTTFIHPKQAQTQRQTNSITLNVNIVPGTDEIVSQHLTDIGSLLTVEELNIVRKLCHDPQLKTIAIGYASKYLK